MVIYRSHTGDRGHPRLWHVEWLVLLAGQCRRLVARSSKGLEALSGAQRPGHTFERKGQVHRLVPRADDYR